MSESKYTPGPWLRDGVTVYALQHHGWRKGEEQFCNRFSFGLQLGPGCTEGELLANAQLAQAAPDLLKALVAMDESMCRGFETRADRDFGRKALIAARAAILKAAGVSHAD